MPQPFVTPDTHPAIRSVPVADASANPRAHSEQTPLDELEELQMTLGYGQSAASLGSIELELLGLRGGRRLGRVEGLAPRDLLGEFRAPVPLGELVAVRLRSQRHRLVSDTFGLVHWQRPVAGRWLAGLFLRECLPEQLLQHVWMDMRRELRYPVQSRFQCRVGDAPYLLAATVCDYSRSGARLRMQAAPARGDTLELIDDDLVAVGTVRYARPAPQAAAMYVGLEFANNEGVRLAKRGLETASKANSWTQAERWQ